MPASVAALLIAVFVVLPGYIAVRASYFVARRERPRVELVQLLECLLFGTFNLVLTVAVAGALWAAHNPGAVRWTSAEQAVDILQAYLSQGPGPWATALLLFFTTWFLFPVLLGAVVALIYSSERYDALARWCRRRWGDHARTWDELFDQRHSLWVHVYTKDDRLLEGRLAQADISPDPPAFWLSEVKWWDDAKQEWREGPLTHLHIDGKNIRYVFLQEPDAWEPSADETKQPAECSPEDASEPQ